MDQLTKSQFILLVLLVSFVTSVVTGIVTVTLVNQAPAPLTQRISKVVEKIVPQIMENDDKYFDSNTVQTKIVSREEIVVGLVEKVSPSVVSIIATKDLPILEGYFIDPFGIPQYRQKGTETRQISSGTGFFVSEDGFLLTNKHVVADTEADYSIVLNDGRQITVQVLARDPIQDIAVLKVDQSDGETEQSFNYAPLGDSEALKVGQTVIAIGNSLGEFQNTVSMGVVSGLNRTVVVSSGVGKTEQLQSLIQTDTAINPGNSGGPLLDIDGRVIGINTATAQGAENVGFALPINIAKKALADTKEFGSIRYAFLGIRYVTINASVKEEKSLSVDYGILLLNGRGGELAVVKDSPAEKAGLKEGDIILEFSGKRIDKKNTLPNLIISKQVGEIVVLKVLRGEEEIEINVTLDERPESL